ncbi:Rpn family recombination-promoting nuclease/putative transposase [Ligilactobacillus agilis]|nr:Rpn family recombination-promoting nuclease/putative transposase [Ligilactobacillus agilis]
MLSEAEKERRWQAAGLENDIIFGLVMGREDICKLFLKSAIPDVDFTDLEVTPQKEIVNHYHSKIVRLDVLAVDEQGNHYDIEIQVKNERNVSQRSKYYHSMMTNRMVGQGESYQKVKATYVIFVCMFNVNTEEALSHFEMINRNNLSEKLNDGTHTILLNVNADSSKLNENLQGLIQVLRRESVNQSQLGQKLSKALKEVKGDMLVKNQLGYASEDMVLYGQQDVIQSLIENKDKLGLSENSIIEIIMEKIHLTKSEAEELYDEMLEDLEKQKQNQK